MIGTIDTLRAEGAVTWNWGGTMPTFKRRIASPEVLAKLAELERNYQGEIRPYTPDELDDLIAEEYREFLDGTGPSTMPEGDPSPGAPARAPADRQAED